MVATPQLRENDLLYEVAAVVEVPCVEQFDIKSLPSSATSASEISFAVAFSAVNSQSRKSLINRILNS